MAKLHDKRGRIPASLFKANHVDIRIDDYLVLDDKVSRSL